MDLCTQVALSPCRAEVADGSTYRSCKESGLPFLQMPQGSSLSLLPPIIPCRPLGVVFPVIPFRRSLRFVLSPLILPSMSLLALTHDRDSVAKTKVASFMASPMSARKGYIVTSRRSSKSWLTMFTYSYDDRKDCEPQGDLFSKFQE